MGNISVPIVYCRGTVGISHCKKTWPNLYNEIKEYRLQNQEIEKKFGVMLTATSECFALLPAFWKPDYLNVNCVCVCVF